MPTVKVSIQPAILRWVLDQLSGEYTDNQLRAMITNWIDGTKAPTFNQIEELSQKSHIPLGYFFLKVPPKEEIGLLKFRTIDSIELAQPSRDLIDTINFMEERQDFMVDYRKQQGMESLSIVGKASQESNSLIIAETMRKDLKLMLDWSCNTRSSQESFNILRVALENAGSMVMMNGIVNNNTHRPLNIEEFRAFALINEYAPLIFINAVDSQGARLFSLLHEAVHIWLGKNDLFNDRRGKSKRPTEVLCNAVAAELLVPRIIFEETWKNLNEVDPYRKITAVSTKFHCGETVIARRAYDFGLIEHSIYENVSDKAINMFLEQKKKKSGGGNYYGTVESRLDRPFVKAICESVKSGDISFTDAYHLTNTNRKTFDKVAEDLGGIL